MESRTGWVLLAGTISGAAIVGGISALALRSVHQSHEAALSKMTEEEHQKLASCEERAAAQAKTANDTRTQLEVRLGQTTAEVKQLRQQPCFVAAAEVGGLEREVSDLQVRRQNAAAELTKSKGEVQKLEADLTELRKKHQHLQAEQKQILEYRRTITEGVERWSAPFEVSTDRYWHFYVRTGGPCRLTTSDTTRGAAAAGQYLDIHCPDNQCASVRSGLTPFSLVCDQVSGIDVYAGTSYRAFFPTLKTSGTWRLLSGDFRASPER